MFRYLYKPFHATQLTDSVLTPDNWVTVPTNSTLTIHKQTVMIHPIIDEYYNPNPSYSRSSGFAVSKGLVSNASGAAQALTRGMNGAVTPALGKIGENSMGDATERLLASNGHMEVARA